MLAVAEDVLAARSVSRNGGHPVSEPPKTKAPAVPNTSHVGQPLNVTAEELETCVRVLRELSKQPGRFFERNSGLNPVRAEANRIVETVRRESDVRRQTRSSSESKTAKEQRKAHDKNVVENTGMRQMRFTVPADTEAGLDAAALKDGRERGEWIRRALCLAVGVQPPVPGKRGPKPKS